VLFFGNAADRSGAQTEALGGCALLRFSSHT
jgi:hypothetical protein